jgi:hypothetical protein
VGRTLLLGSPGHTWREWIKSNLQGRDLIVLDPGLADFAHAGQISVIRGERTVAEAFVGGLEASIAPHVITAGFRRLLFHAGPDAMVLSFSWHASPLLRQVLREIVLIGEFSEIFVPEGLVVADFLRVTKRVALKEAASAQVQQAQRKAHWLGLLERCERHVLGITEVSILGSRLGSGQRLSQTSLQKLDFEESYAEVINRVLLVVSDREFEDRVIARALDYTHCKRAHFVSPSQYEGLMCAFEKQNGDLLGTGMIERIDLEALRIFAKCTAVGPVPVPFLNLGTLRIDAKGNELGHLKPWQV